MQQLFSITNICITDIFIHYESLLCKFSKMMWICNVYVIEIMCSSSLEFREAGGGWSYDKKRAETPAENGNRSAEAQDQKVSYKLALYMFFKRLRCCLILILQ